jgi:exopolysaccharide biosynthesis polyprenyl glycosylphosphotransferase
LVLMLGDALAVIGAVIIALFVWSQVARYPFTLGFVLPETPWFLILLVIWFSLSVANGYYELALAARRFASIQKLILITLQLLIVYLIVFFLSDRNALPRLFIFYYGIASFFLLILSRTLNPVLLGWASAPRRILIIGTDQNAHIIIQTIQRDSSRSYDVRGVIGKEDEVGQAIENVPVLGTGADLANFIARDSISELVMTSTRMDGVIFQAVMDAYEHGVAITPMPLLYERITERVPVEYVGDNWMVVLPLGDKPPLAIYPALKRVFDWLIGLLGLLVLAVLLPLIALAIRLDSKGDIFYQQVRVGKNGRLFKIVKFRSMVADAEKVTGAVFAGQNDSRVTRVGRFMRKTRIDELPQLWNIVQGDMSLVGPRPERPEHVNRLQESIPFYRTRLIVPPGLTGWAQVRYKYGADDRDALIKLQYDLFYIRHQSAMLDFSILLRTVGKVLGMGGQ